MKLPTSVLDSNGIRYAQQCLHTMESVVVGTKEEEAVSAWRVSDLTPLRGSTEKDLVP